MGLDSDPISQSLYHDESAALNLNLAKRGLVKDIRGSPAGPDRVAVAIDLNSLDRKQSRMPQLHASLGINFHRPDQNLSTWA